MATVELVDADEQAVMFARIDLRRKSSPIIYRGRAQRQELYQLLPRANSKRRQYDVLEAGGTSVGRLRMKLNGRLRGKFYRQGEKVATLKANKGQYAFHLHDPHAHGYVLLLHDTVVMRLAHRPDEEYVTITQVGPLDEEVEGFLLAGLCMVAAFQME
ncbi:MAG: hypothetical protein ACLFU8_17995 [Anaerolineales bacterium]